MTTDKQARQSALLRLVLERPVRSQQEAVRLMRERGHKATQASISRDVRDLGLVKLGGRYIQAARAMDRKAPLPSAEPAHELIIACEPIGANLVVVRTRVGAAGSVAAVLDERKLTEMAGTLAGDDTIFIAVRSRSDQGRVIAALNTWVQGK